VGRVDQYRIEALLLKAYERFPARYHCASTACHMQKLRNILAGKRLASD
jgi:hypothetical protein